MKVAGTNANIMNSDLPTTEISVKPPGAVFANARISAAEERKHTFLAEFAALERERRRFAKDLHDEVLPQLARLTRYLKAQATISSEPDGRELTELLHKTVADLRDLLGDLHPVDLEEFGLVPALNNLAQRHARQSGLCIPFVERAEHFPLDENTELFLYRAFQSVLRMFTASGNDILVLTCEQMLDTNFITARCVDKSVASAHWLSMGRNDPQMFESCCEMAGAQLEIESGEYGEFPCDLIVSIKNSIELRSLESSSSTKSNSSKNGSISTSSSSKNSNVSSGQKQVRQAELSESSTSFEEALTIAAERERISKEIERSITSSFREMQKLALKITYTNPYAIEFILRLQSIEISLKDIVAELKPQQLEESGFLSSVKTMIERFRAESGIATSFNSKLSFLDLNLSISAKYAIYRMIQEALTNIEKHSGASQAQVLIEEKQGVIRICIEDNGKGFASNKEVRSKIGSQSRGLRIIESRAASIGANISLNHSVQFPNGTCLEIRLG